jgi:hypothetical protein
MSKSKARPKFENPAAEPPTRAPILIVGESEYTTEAVMEGDCVRESTPKVPDATVKSSTFTRGNNVGCSIMRVRICSVVMVYLGMRGV